MRTASAITLCAGLGLCCSAIPAQRAAELFERLSPERRAAQLIVQWSLSRNDDGYPLKGTMLEWVQDLGIGGVVLSIGEVEDAAALIAELQAAAEVPLLFAGDFEAGVAFRLKGATSFGNNMLLAATGQTSFAREAGRITATEGRALGFHWCFAPVVDVNVDPRNPIINVRSFGEDPEFVASMGAAFIDGLQAHGLIATAKHFPGHGDVASDSHLVMPTVPGDRNRLARVELVPFRHAIRHGVQSVMTGHLSVPGLGEAPTVPATLSRRILTDVLRGELGFGGLVVTDALDMGGVRQAIKPEDAAVRALAAGADVLLMPPDPLRARDAVLAAVVDGRLPRERFDAAVLAVLRAKERLGLLDGERTGPAADWRSHVATPAQRALADDVARRGLTLVQDRLGLVPLSAPQPPPTGGAARSITLLTIADAADAEVGRPLENALTAEGIGLRGGHHRVHPDSDRAVVASALDAARDAGTLIAALHVRVRSYSGRIGLPPALTPVLEVLRRAPRAVVVSFGNPYLLTDFPEVSTYLCAFAATGHTERAVARALAGRAAVTGRMPVGIPGTLEAGQGLSFLPDTDRLDRVAPGGEGLAADLHEQLRERLAKGVDEKVFPGAVAVVARRRGVVAAVAVGRETYDPDAAPVAIDSRFDLASLTKVCATTPAVLTLVDAGRVSLDDRVVEHVPEFRGEHKDAVTLRHLLTHTSGLPPFVKYFLEVEGRDAVVERVLREPLRSKPGERYAYSDLGMILLMRCVEKASGQRFADYVRSAVFTPLGVEATFAVDNVPVDAVPTERCAWRGRVVRGQVHDENAFAMGGVSGHAGLFGTAEDVARIGVAFLGGGRGWLSAPVCREAVRRQDVVDGSSRALGWDTFSPGGSGGSLLAPESFGHTGFTGTSVWCDPRRDLTIVLLTNRVHPTRDNRAHRQVRSDVADLVVRSLR